MSNYFLGWMVSEKGFKIHQRNLRMPERGLKELSKSLKKSAKKDMTDLCIASSMCPLELMKSIRYDIFSYNIYKVQKEKKDILVHHNICESSCYLLYLQLRPLCLDIYFLKSFWFWLKNKFNWLLFNDRRWQETRVPRRFWDQRIRRSLTWTEWTTTVWPQGSDSDPWTTCPEERRLWLH